jgi:hypothetical protein
MIPAMMTKAENRKDHKNEKEKSQNDQTVLCPWHFRYPDRRIDHHDFG